MQSKYFKLHGEALHATQMDILQHKEVIPIKKVVILVDSAVLLIHSEALNSRKVRLQIH